MSSATRLIPALPRWVIEKELITEFLFFDSLFNQKSPESSRQEFNRRLPTDPGLPRFGRAATTWAGFLEECIRTGLVECNGAFGLTTLGREHLEGLRDEAHLRSIALPSVDAGSRENWDEDPGTARIFEKLYEILGRIR